jgi:hypothetical protein
MRDVQRAISDRIWGNIMVEVDKARMNRECWSSPEIRAEISKISSSVSVSVSVSVSFSQRRRRRDEVEFEEVSN